MACNINNIKIGPCNVEINDTDIGMTKGGVILSINSTAKSLNSDHFGNVLPDRSLSKRKVTVKIPFAESTMENLQIAIPNSTLTTNGQKQRLDVYAEDGQLLRANSFKIKLIPILSGDENETVTFPVAVTAGTTSLSWQMAKERVFEVEFEALEDANGLLMFFGDATA